MWEEPALAKAGGGDPEGGSQRCHSATFSTGHSLPGPAVGRWGDRGSNTAPLSDLVVQGEAGYNTRQ